MFSKLASKVICRGPHDCSRPNRLKRISEHEKEEAVQLVIGYNARGEQ